MQLIHENPVRPRRVLWLIVIFLSAMAVAQTNPVPLVYQPLIPATIKPGHKAFALTVNGTGFATDAVLNWNGSTRLTEVVSNHQLRATIDAEDVAKTGTASITVTNPPPGGGTSNVVFLPIRKPSSFVILSPIADFPAAPVNAVGDFNNDGKLDIAVGLTNSDGSGEIDIYLGNGDGTFRPPVKTKTVVADAVMLAADFNGDGKLDLAVLDGLGNTTIFLGRGNGKMVQQQVFDSYCCTVKAADFNRDGKLDLLATGGSYGAVYLGNGDGTFGSPIQISTQGYQLDDPAIADFNGDGDLDLAASDFYNRSLFILLGNGDGTFQQGMPYKTAYYGYSATAADVNGDGNLDVVTSGFEVMLGKGDGTFTSDGGFNLGNYSSGADVAIGDFNGDGKLDAALIQPNGSSDNIDFFQGNGDGTFQSPIAFLAGNSPNSLNMGDFNGDGRLDLVGGNLFLQTSVMLAPSSLAFGIENVGSHSAPLIAKLTNDGSSKLQIKQIGINGTNSTDFAQTNNCGKSVRPGGSCKIQVVFTPTATGARSASLFVEYQGVGSPETVALSGTGANLTVTLTPSSMTFPVQVVGTTSSEQTATLTNTGSDAVTISNISTSGPFSQTNNCPSSLYPTNSCQIQVRFTPTAKGPASGTLSVTDAAQGSPQTVSLAGTGTVVELSTVGINFGDQKVGSKSPPAPIKLTNVGTTSLSISQIAITGADAGDFSQSNNCGSSVPSKGSCKITVIFKPTAKGERAAILSITDDGGASPQMVSLAGTGT